jgi:hypothetical protein
VKRPCRESNPRPPGTALCALTTELQGRYGFNSCMSFNNAPANAKAQCRGGGGAAGWLNEKFPKPTFFGYFMVQISSV